MGDRRVLVYSVSESDSLLAQKVLGSASIDSVVCRDGSHMLDEVRADAGALLIVEELIGGVADALLKYLEQQAPWSDLPILVLTKYGSDSIEAQRAIERLGNVTLLERPVRTMALISAARSALRARDRQYQVREADRRKDEFLATLAHELRNPLAPIRNAMSIFQRLEPSPELGKLISIVERQVSHLTRLVDDLLDVARISNGKVVLQLQQTSIRAVVMHATEIAGAAIAEKAHELVVVQPQAEHRLLADHVRVVQSLANLLVNAAKFTPRSGRIGLTVEVHGSKVDFRVRDNGRGIEADSLARIFELFAQARAPGEPSNGLGIGLNLAKRLAQLHGGTLHASSAGLGQGSEFVLSLPVVAMDEGPVVEHEEAVLPQPGDALPRKVLVVDDNLDAANTLVSLLELQGISVAAAYDGAAALAAVREDPPDVVLMDIGMPHINGYEAARMIRRELASQPITLIALTGWGQFADFRLAQEAGFDFHFVKPVDFGVLMDCLQRTGATSLG